MPTEFHEGTDNDNVLSFMLGENVRGRFARIDKSLSHILSQHKYPDKVSNLIAEAILLTVMIGQAVKLKWKLSVQIRGSGSIKLIAVDYFSPKDDGFPVDIRAYAKFDFQSLDTAIESDDSDLHLFGKGFFAILIDQGAGTEPYQGITPLTGNSLASCAETYFHQSEQLSTAFKIIVGKSDIAGDGGSWRGGGIMLQQLPNVDISKSFSDGAVIDPNLKRSIASHAIINDDGEHWLRANILMNTVEELELVGPQLTPSEVLTRLFHDEYLLMFKSQELRFGCSCSIDKVSRTLSIYSSKDIQSMITEEGTVTADCQFCGEHYVLNPSQLGFESEG